MSDASIKPCRKCGAQDRNKRGDCNACRKEYARKYREVNRVEVVERTRKWREANREKARKSVRKWVEANPKRVREAIRNWQKANPEKVKIHHHDRRARTKGNGGKLSKNIIQTLLDRQGNKCACCGTTLQNGFHLDHIIPLAKGGTNTDSNVQLLTPKCNLIKGPRLPEDYMRLRQKGL